MTDVVALKDVDTGRETLVTRVEAAAFAASLGAVLAEDQTLFPYSSAGEDVEAAFEAADYAKIAGI